MREEEDDVQPRTAERAGTVERSSPMRRVGVWAVVLLVVFLLGLVPMWLKSRGYASSLAEANQQLSLARMQNNLSSAVIDARRGDYEPARQAASQFFTDLRAEVDKAGESSLTQPQRDGVQPLFAQRDELITLLARNDPAAAERLSDLHASYRKIVAN
jgi:hypothetical protein